MKDKIMLFIIGVLVGSVISTGIFYIYTIANSSESSNNTQMSEGMPNGGPPGMSNGQMPDGEPPEKPSGDFDGNGQPPEKPDESNSQSNEQSNKK